MENLTHYPALLFAVAFIVVARFSRGRLVAQTPREEQKDALSLILAASLTLLALIIGHQPLRGHCAVLQRVVWLSDANDRQACSHASAGRLDFTAFDRRYRCAAAWPYPRQSAEPAKLGQITRALTFIAKVNQFCRSS